MILAVDVSYCEGGAVAAGVLLERWEDRQPRAEIVARIPSVAPYVPGQLYRRELPPVLELMRQLVELPEYIVVDAYVYLDARGRPGFGKHLYDALGGRPAVIGVAKSRYRDTPPGAALFRGGSKRPLYITSAGIDPVAAVALIMRMHGEHRLPALLRRADRLARTAGMPGA